MRVEGYWRRKSFAEMSEEEWESLCDGCGKCCLHKLEDEDTGEIFYTEVACRLLDLNTCQCTQYAERLGHVPECINLQPQDVDNFTWLPATCAYRLVAEGNDLPPWHHLRSGSKTSIHHHCQSVKGRVLAEQLVAEEDLEEHIVHWVE